MWGVPTSPPLPPLLQVGMVYDGQNMWANVQVEGHPWSMTWDFTNANQWRPFFGLAMMPRELASLQVCGGEGGNGGLAMMTRELASL